MEHQGAGCEGEVAEVESELHPEQQQQQERRGTRRREHVRHNTRGTRLGRAEHVRDLRQRTAVRLRRRAHWSAWMGINQI